MKVANSKKTKPQKPVNKQINEKKKLRLRKEIIGFTSDHKEIIDFLLQKYENGAANQSFDTGLAAFARLMYRSKLLCYFQNEDVKSLSIGSVETEVREVWKAIKEERENIPLRKK